MSPQEEIELPLVPNQSWLNELFHRCQLDPNQTALDFVQHAFRHSFESPEAVSSGLQMFAQQILFQVDRRQNHHRTTPSTTAQPLLSFATTLYSQCVPKALTNGVPIPPVRARPGRPKKRNESISATNATTTTTTTSKTTASSVAIDEATRPSGKGAAETLQLPVEKLCIETGKVLQRFQTGEEAKQSVTYNSHSHSFYNAVVGKNKSSQPHVYKSFFWRLEGSSHRPGGCPCHYQNLLEKSSANNHANYTNNVNALQREPMRDVPVEKLCLETGRVLERFDTAEQAYLAMTDAKKPLFGNFKQVLQGLGSYPHHIYKGHFWRIVGSNKLPHTISLREREQHLDDDTTRKEKSTPSSARTKTQSPSDETTTTNSKRQSQNLAKKPSVNNFDSHPREPMRDFPVEKLCLETGRVLERFDTAEHAFLATTDAKKPHFANFKKVLEGRGSYPNHIYKGHFWRIVGSNKLPHTISLSRKQQDLDDDTTRKEKSTPSSARTKKQSPSDETATATSKREYQNLAKKAPANNVDSLQIEPNRDTPVEKLCLETGRVLERFDTAEEAYLATTDAKKPLFASFKQVLLGRGCYPHHIYKGHFWRIVGSNKLPHTIALSRKQQDLDDDTARKEKSTPSSARTKKQNPSDETTPTTSKRQYDITLPREATRDTPVEKLCLETGRVLERFDTAEQAYRAMTDSKKPQFYNFKQVLQGIGSYHHHIYKGHFWRVVGSNKLPPTISSRGKQQDLEDGTTRKEKLTSSSDATKKRSRSHETATTTSKRRKSDYQQYHASDSITFANESQH